MIFTVFPVRIYFSLCEYTYYVPMKHVFFIAIFVFFNTTPVFRARSRQFLVFPAFRLTLDNILYKIMQIHLKICIAAIFVQCHCVSIIIAFCLQVLHKANRPFRRRHYPSPYQFPKRKPCILAILQQHSEYLPVHSWSRYLRH